MGSISTIIFVTDRLRQKNAQKKLSKRCIVTANGTNFSVCKPDSYDYTKNFN